MADSILLYPWGQSYNQVDSLLIETNPKYYRLDYLEKQSVYLSLLFTNEMFPKLEMKTHYNFSEEKDLCEVSNSYSQIAKVVKFGNRHALRSCLL